MTVTANCCTVLKSGKIFKAIRTKNLRPLFGGLTEFRGERIGLRLGDIEVLLIAPEGVSTLALMGSALTLIALTPVVIITPGALLASRMARRFQTNLSA